VPSWGELLQEFQANEPEDRTGWLVARLTDSLKEVSSRRSNRNVVLYASGWLQRPDAPASALQISPEDINGFMAVLHGMDFDKGLSIVLHTPGGVTNATETIVQYLRSKFTDIEVIIPAYAMSAGTMISLAANRILMDRASQLGPIDPQMPVGPNRVAANSIVMQFEMAKDEIKQNQRNAAAWGPILHSIGPALLNEARNALAYGERIVAGWLEQNMLKGTPDARQKAASIAAFFNEADNHKSHGARIDRDQAAEQGVIIERLDDNQETQEAVLTLYHVITLVFEQTATARLIMNDAGRQWAKTLSPPQQQLEPRKARKSGEQSESTDNQA